MLPTGSTDYRTATTSDSSCDAQVICQLGRLALVKQWDAGSQTRRDCVYLSERSLPWGRVSVLAAVFSSFFIHPALVTPTVKPIQFKTSENPPNRLQLTAVHKDSIAVSNAHDQTATVLHTFATAPGRSEFLKNKNEHELHGAISPNGPKMRLPVAVRGALTATTSCQSQGLSIFMSRRRERDE